MRMEVSFDSIRTAIDPRITRPNWLDAVRGLGRSRDHPPDQRRTPLTLRTRLEIKVAWVIVQQYRNVHRLR